MDQMDYQMEDGQTAQNPNAAHQCHPYQQPHHSPNPNTFAPQSRDAHHYDPVHNTEWYQANGSGAPSRPSYAATQNISQWGPGGAYVPINRWPGFAEAHAGGPVPEGPGYRQQTGFMGMPGSSWNEMRGYEPLPFGYGAYSGIGAPPELNSTGRSPVTGPSPPVLTSQLQNMAALQTEAARGAARASHALNATEDLAAMRAAARRAREERAERALQNQAQRVSEYPHSSSLDPSRPRRRTTNTWDSDDDEDSFPDPEIDSYHRGSEFVTAEMDEERHMAAIRGAIAAGKKVPSKEFIASLEKVPTQELKEADRTCMICYNEFGVANPDGILEHPIRLPKCKHVFGDKCIKKWFEDSDSCPYCRDKLPSELAARKPLALESLQQARRERLAVVAAAGQGHGYRPRHGYPPRYPGSDELVHGNSSAGNYFRHTQEDYHYLMRTGMPPDPWSYSPPNRSSPRESPENRRRQARGRVGLGRPTSIGSARYNMSPSGNHQNPQRVNLQNITPNTHTTAPPPRRSITPGLPRQNSTGSNGSTIHTQSRNRLSGSSSSSSEEASPPVAVGSGIAAGERQIPATQNAPGSFGEYMNSQWNDPFGAFLNQGEGGFLGRNARRDMGPGRPTDTEITHNSTIDHNIPARGGDYHEAMGVNPLPRWSR